MTRPRLLGMLFLLLLSCAVVIGWHAFDMPPVCMVLKHGYPSPMCPTGRTVTLEGVEFVEISPGYYQMGSEYWCERGDLLGRLSAIVGLSWGTLPHHNGPAGDSLLRECPVHWVELESGLWIARTEVTNEQYERFDPTFVRCYDEASGDFNPASGVSWVDAKRYCVWLSARAGLPVRLPSESEWECACRAGTRTEFAFGDAQNRLSKYAWWEENSEYSTGVVGLRQANGWGLCDMHGNAWEWCEDAWHWNYDKAPANSAAWTDEGIVDFGVRDRVIRGGDAGSEAEHCRSAWRSSLDPASRGFLTGVRPAFLWRYGAAQE